MGFRSAGRFFGVAATILSSFALDVVAAPQPKAAWVRGARSRLAKSSKWNSERELSNSSQCEQTSPADFKAPFENVWASLTDDEAASVAAWLFHQPELNLTVSDKTGEWDNSLLLVELMVPNKTDILAYIDGNATAPARYAHAVLDIRATEEPTYTDILVGPIPVVNGTTTWQPLEYPYTRKTGGSIRNLDADSDSLYSEYIYKTLRWISGVEPLWVRITILWISGVLTLSGNMMANRPAGTPSGISLTMYSMPKLCSLSACFFKSDVTGRDPSKWKLEGWLYNDVFYPTTEAFRTAYWSGNFTKLGANVEGDWARTDQDGPVLAMDDQSPPVAVTLAGARYSVDHEEQYVEWMGFSFYLSFSRDTGLSLFDIRHKGQRILYELGLQEALAHYAGNDPVQSGTSYLDTYYGFGPYAFQLVPGYDCPSYATYMNTWYYVDETTHTHINSVCFFEFDADYPMQRHSTSSYVANTKNVYFSVRSVSTVGNYDYMFTYSFHMDGSIHVEVRASGYIQSAYYAHNADYGYHIHDYLSGSMHD
ncbi:hypothetical protein D0869_14743, partial [Hortaea werneckii]